MQNQEPNDQTVLCLLKPVNYANCALIPDIFRIGEVKNYRHRWI